MIIEIPRYTCGISSTCMVKMDEDMLGKEIHSRIVIWNYFGLKLDENGYIRKDLGADLFVEHANEAFRRRMETPATCLHTYANTILVCIWKHLLYLPESNRKIRHSYQLFRFDPKRSRKGPHPT